MTVLWLGLMVGSVHAQITSVSGTVRDEMETLIGATVCEVDATGRNINATITDFNGHFAMKVKSTKNKLKVSFMGYKTQTLPINRTVYNITLESAQRVMKEVSVVSKKAGGLLFRKGKSALLPKPYPQKNSRGWALRLSMKLCKDVSPGLTSFPILVIWEAGPRCVCAERPPSVR